MDDRNLDNVESKQPLSSPDDRLTVLYIDDNSSNLRLMERVLEARPHVHLLVATTGRAGVELAVAHQPQLVLLDLGLPDISGEEVLRQLRTHPATAQVPIVIVSADATAGRSSALRNLGATAYLTKPFNFTRIYDLVDRSIENWPDDIATNSPTAL